VLVTLAESASDTVYVFTYPSKVCMHSVSKSCLAIKLNARRFYNLFDSAVYETLIQCSEWAITRCELLNSSKLVNAVNFIYVEMQNQFLSMHDINVKTKLFWHPVYIAMLAMHI